MRVEKTGGTPLAVYEGALRHVHGFGRRDVSGVRQCALAQRVAVFQGGHRRSKRAFIAAGLHSPSSRQGNVQEWARSRRVGREQPAQLRRESDGSS